MSSDRHSESDLDSIRNSCDFFYLHGCFCQSKISQQNFNKHFFSRFFLAANVGFGGGTAASGNDSLADLEK